MSQIVKIYLITFFGGIHYCTRRELPADFSTERIQVEVKVSVIKFFVGE